MVIQRGVVGLSVFCVGDWPFPLLVGIQEEEEFKRSRVVPTCLLPVKQTLSKREIQELLYSLLSAQREREWVDRAKGSFSSGRNSLRGDG